MDQFLANLWTRIKIDWWEFTNLGWVGYIRFGWDWLKYLTGFSNYRPDWFAYGEVDRDMDFDFDKDD